MSTSPNTLSEPGRLLVGLGLVLAVPGGLLFLTARVPWIGRLPGDITWQRDRFTF